MQNHALSEGTTPSLAPSESSRGQVLLLSALCNPLSEWITLV